MQRAAYQCNVVPRISQVGSSERRYSSTEAVSCGNDVVGRIRSLGTINCPLDNRLCAVPRVKEAGVSLASRADGPCLHSQVQIRDPVLDRDASAERDDNQLIRMIKRHEALCVAGSNTVKNACVSMVGFAAGQGRWCQRTKQYFSNSRMDCAPALWTRGQFPALQVMAVLESGMLFAGQYAAAEYCSKNDNWSSSSWEIAGDSSISPLVVGREGFATYLFCQVPLARPVQR